MNSHDLANLLLSVPAQDLRDMGSNERYANRFDLKGLKVPGIASLGGWVYPEGDTTPAPKVVKAAPVAVKPVQRAKRANSQAASAPVTAPPAQTSPAPAGQAITAADLQALMMNALKAAGINVK